MRLPNLGGILGTAYGTVSPGATAPASAMDFGGFEMPDYGLNAPNPFASPIPDPATVGALEFPEIGLGDLEVKYEDPTRHLSGLHMAVAERISGGSQATKAINQTMAAALGGKSLDEQRREAFEAAKAQKVDEQLAKTAHLDDAQFAQQIERLRAEVGGVPTMPERAPLEAPNLGQMAVALFGALTNPKYAAEIASTPFLQQLQAQALADQRGMQQFEVDQQNYKTRVGLAGDELESFNRRDLARAQLEQQDENQREISRRAAVSELNSGAVSVAQMQANIAAFEESQGPLDPAVKEAMLTAAAEKEKEASDLKRFMEQGRNDRAKMTDDRLRWVQTQRSTDKHLDGLLRMVNSGNPEARMVGGQRLRETHPLFEGLSDEEILRIARLTPNERRADEAAKTDAATRDGRVKGEDLRNQERAIDIEIKQELAPIRKLSELRGLELKTAQRDIARLRQKFMPNELRMKIAKHDKAMLDAYTGRGQRTNIGSLRARAAKFADAYANYDREVNLLKARHEGIQSGRTKLPAGIDRDAALLGLQFAIDEAASKRRVAEDMRIRAEADIAGADPVAPGRPLNFGVTAQGPQEQQILAEANEALASGKVPKEFLMRSVKQEIARIRGGR